MKDLETVFQKFPDSNTYSNTYRLEVSESGYHKASVRVSDSEDQRVRSKTFVLASQMVHDFQFERNQWKI